MGEDGGRRADKLIMQIQVITSTLSINNRNVIKQTIVFTFA